jgi:hypothetical protein
MKKAKKTLIVLTVLLFQLNLFGQDIENMDKKELRGYCSYLLHEIDSLNSVITTTKHKYIELSSKIDNKISEFNELKVFKEKIDLKYENCEKDNIDIQKQLTKIEAHVRVLNDSLDYCRTINEKSITYSSLRELIIQKYIMNRTFKLQYYNENVGTGGNYSIAKINGKYYKQLSQWDFEEEKEKIKITEISKQESYYNNWKFFVNDKLEFKYLQNEVNKTGTINPNSFDVGENQYPDSIIPSSVILNDTIFKLPLGNLELETGRGPWDFIIYYYIGRVEYYFNDKKHYTYNPIVLESDHVEIILTENN